MSQPTVEEQPVSENPGKMYINPETTRLMIEDITGFKCESVTTEDLADRPDQVNVNQS